MELTDLESDILTWLREATRGRANLPAAAASYLAGNQGVDKDRFAAAVDALEAFGLVTSIRAWGGHVYRLSLKQQALILGREDQTGITIHNSVDNTMIGSPGGQQTPTRTPAPPVTSRTNWRKRVPSRVAIRGQARRLLRADLPPSEARQPLGVFLIANERLHENKARSCRNTFGKPEHVGYLRSLQKVAHDLAEAGTHVAAQHYRRIGATKQLGHRLQRLKSHDPFGVLTVHVAFIGNQAKPKRKPESR